MTDGVPDTADGEQPGPSRLLSLQEAAEWLNVRRADG